MKLKSVTVQNFLSYGPEVVIPLDITGLVLIVGDNKDAEKADSNGVGKSGLLHAIAYGLWGRTVYGQKADEVIHNGVNKNCKVKLTIEDDNTIYEVIRTRACSSETKPNDLVLIKDNIDISASTIDETQNKINSIVGMTFEIFTALMPGCGVEIATLTDKEIKELLEAILKTNELSIAHEIALERYKKLDKEISVNLTTIASKESYLEECNTRINEYEEKSNSFENDKQAEIDQLDKELAQLSHTNLEELKEQILKDVKKQVNLKKLLAKALELLAKNNTSKINLNLEFANKNSKLCTQLKDFIQRKNNLLKLRECPTCYSTVCDTHKDEVLKGFEEAIKNITHEIELLDADENARQFKLEELTKKYDKNKSILEAEISLLEKRISSNKEKYSKAEQINFQISVLTNQVEISRSRVNTFINLIEKERIKQSILESEIALMKVDVLSNKEHLAILEYWVKSFSPSGIRSYMIDTVVPYLNDRVKYYSDLLTSGDIGVFFNTKTSQKNGKIVEKFNIEVTQKYGANQFKGISKGEKARANLIISLALGDLANLRASKKLSFRFFDEVFDCIDSTGCEAVCNLLTLCTEQYYSIYVITHKDEFKKLFNKKIVVTKHNGFSNIKEIEE